MAPSGETWNIRPNNQVKPTMQHNSFYGLYYIAQIKIQNDFKSNKAQALLILS